MMTKLYRWLHEWRGALIVLLSVVALALLQVSMFLRLTHEGLTIEEVRVWIDAAYRGSATVLAILAGIAAYYRFLAGRVLARRAKVNLSITRIAELSDGRMRLGVSGSESEVNVINEPSWLYGVDVGIENVGSRSIVDPIVELAISTLDDESIVNRDQIARDGIVPVTSNSLEVIDPGEVSTVHCRMLVPIRVPVFAAQVTVRASSHVWSRATTISNAKETTAREELPVLLEVHIASPTSATVMGVRVDSDKVRLTL